MPLITICGFPCSGKTRAAQQLAAAIASEAERRGMAGHKAVVVAEEDFHASPAERRATPTAEKQTHGYLRAEAERHLQPNTTVIVDGLNYVKGFRYELYCQARAAQTTHLTLFLATRDSLCLEWDTARGSLYGEELAKALIMRFEPPDNRHRWDAPLFVAEPDEPLPVEDILAALFDKKAKPAHCSTLQQPAVEANFLHVLDRITKEIVAAVVEAGKTAVPGDKVVVPNTEAKVLLRKTPTLLALRRVQRQFISYTKQNPVSDAKALAGLFVDFINASDAVA